MTQPGDGVTATAVREATFPKPPFGKRGYDEGSVNDLLALAARRLDGRGYLRAADIRDVVFRPAPLLSRGFDRGAVDEFVARLAAAVAELEASDPV
ncbi:MAG: DivIVA domain-containing protein [Mycobacterium sp.]|jgi:DivIVA domain-containing protein|nr:DivIVA domain-containing protein [Mycobacterium sp.]